MDMKIYTKNGDKGQTQLFGGTAVRKDDDRLSAYGTLDELNSQIGLICAWIDHEKSESSAEKTLDVEIRDILAHLQNDLFNIGSHLALGDEKLKKHLPPLSQLRPEILETEIDRMDEQLPPLKNFIMPGGSILSAQIHIARTVARRAEREIVKIEPTVPSEIIVFMNRLSDYLFVVARRVNQIKKNPELEWRK